MRCPYCHEQNDKVIDSRASEGGVSIRRRRQCLACNRRFTTYEHVETANRLAVIKKDGSRVPFDRDKILAGLQKACYKRPVSAEQINRIVDEVEEQMLRTHEKEVQAIAIGRVVMEKLKGLDQVAYVRYASVYKSFRDIDDLLNEVRDMIDTTSPDDPANQGKLF